MFRPDRIGTPVIFEQSTASNSAAWTPSTTNSAAVGFRGNVINGTPVADFAMSALTWNQGTASIANGDELAILQQFTISQPLNGDTVGIELNFGLRIYMSNLFSAWPYV